MKVSFLEVAATEYKEAFEYYELEQVGLGERFKTEVRNAISRIAAHPNAYQKLSKQTRRCLISKFPYGIIFQHSDEEVTIIALAHLHRRPDYWHSRNH